MVKTNLTPQKGVSHVESFKVAGVTFNDRQRNLKKILEQKQKGKAINIGIEQYDYKGEPAISVTANGLDIGSLQKKDADYVLANRERIIGFTDLYIDSFKNEENKLIYYARVELLVKNKAAAETPKQEEKTPPVEVSAPELPANGKKPIFKNWKFWVAVGAALTVIYIIAVAAGFTK